MRGRGWPSRNVVAPRSRGALALLTACLFLHTAIPRAEAQDDSSSTATDTIQGTVVNSITGQGIGRALVFSPDNRFATMTDGVGHFEFIVPKSQKNEVGSGVFIGSASSPIAALRSYMLSARKPGFLEDPERSTLSSPGSSVTIPLVPEAVIEGRISLSDSDAAAGINVELFSRQVQDGRSRWTPAQSARANSDGEFRFADLRAGVYKVMTTELFDTDPVDNAPNAQVYAFPPVCFPGVPDFASGQTLQVNAGQIIQTNIPLKRQPYFRVQIPVANFGEGFGLNIRVLAQGHPGPGYSLGYNSNTQRIEGLLPRGNYLVEATSFGPNAAGGSVNMSVAGNVTDGPTLTMISGTLISVNVHEEFSSTDWSGTASFGGAGGRSYAFRGGPRTYLNMSLEPADDFNGRGGAGLRPPRSANDNELAIEGAQAGHYWVRVNTARGYVASLTSGTTDLLHEPLTVTPGGSTPIDVTLRDDFARLQGKVMGLSDTSSGAAQQGMNIGNAGSSAVSPSAHIYCIPLPNSSGQFRDFWASSDGSFDMPQIAPGTYRVLAFNRPQRSLAYRDVDAMRAYESQGEVVHLSSGQTQHVQLRLISGEN